MVFLSEEVVGISEEGSWKGKEENHRFKETFKDVQAVNNGYYHIIVHGAEDSVKLRTEGDIGEVFLVYDTIGH